MRPPAFEIGLRCLAERPCSRFELHDTQTECRDFSSATTSSKSLEKVSFDPQKSENYILLENRKLNL